jgi:Domain of unknown function (DUF3291)
MALISVTRLRVRSIRYLPAFIFYAVRSARQARRSAGVLGTGPLREANRTFWTRTAWQDEASMRTFMLAMPHRRAMQKLADWCDEASVVHWTQETPTLPDWQEAYRRMSNEGRISKVKYPSADQKAFKISPPRFAKP